MPLPFFSGELTCFQRNAYTPKGMVGEPVRTLVQWVKDKVGVQ